MTERKLFVVTADMPDWQKWLVAKEIAERIINISPISQSLLREELTIIADSESETGPRLRKEIENITNALLLSNFCNKIEIKNPHVQTVYSTQFISSCRILSI